MTIRHHLAQLLRYNSWANQSLLTAIPPEVLDVPMKSSFPTIRRTALHIWDAEWVWFERVNGRSPGDLDLEFFDGPFEEALRRMRKQNDEWIAAVESRTDDELSASIDYLNIKGEPFTRTFDEIVMHVCNHSTFHRGQIVTMLRENGVTEIPPTDMSVYFRIAR
jgi:uncharacterized damage-inducible protein DinB